MVIHSCKFFCQMGVQSVCRDNIYQSKLFYSIRIVNCHALPDSRAAVMPHDGKMIKTQTAHYLDLIRPFPLEYPSWLLPSAGMLPSP